MWEYKIVAQLSMGAADLNEHGRDGWEHYFVVGNLHYFKRFVKVVNAGKGSK